MCLLSVSAHPGPYFQPGPGGVKPKSMWMVFLSGDSYTAHKQNLKKGTRKFLIFKQNDSFQFISALRKKKMHISVAKKCSLIWRDILKNSRTQKCFNWTDRPWNTVTASQFLFRKMKKCCEELSGFPDFHFKQKATEAAINVITLNEIFIKLWHHSEWNIFSAMPQELAFWHCWTRGNTLCFLGSDSLPQGTNEARKAGKESWDKLSHEAIYESEKVDVQKPDAMQTGH